MGGRGSSGGKSSGSKTSGTMSTDKSFDQIQAETQQLQEFPAGTKIEVLDYSGKMQVYTAHDQASMGRNGRMRRLRRYSILTGSTVPGRATSSTTDPYYIAQKPWRKL